MKLLFPGEIANIQAKLVDHEQATIMSGAATRADITAGEALGRQVAELFIARARGDNAGKAVGYANRLGQFYYRYNQSGINTLVQSRNAKTSADVTALLTK